MTKAEYVLAEQGLITVVTFVEDRSRVAAEFARIVAELVEPLFDKYPSVAKLEVRR